MSEELQQAADKKQGPESMTRKPIRCDADHCGHPAMSTIELHFYCVDHFISYSYERLQQCRPAPFFSEEDGSSGANARFLQQCVDQATSLLRPLRGLDNLDRARLFDILLWASELATTSPAVMRQQKTYSKSAG
jgi:hypothetical protein